MEELDSVALVPASAVASGSRVDRVHGIGEEIGFFRSGRVELFEFLHAPLREPVGGVVICCPLQAEVLRNYRREFMLGRSLASRGFAVQRFHYRGTGNSGGSQQDATLDSMIEDSLAAADRLMERMGVANLTFVGTRLGGWVAAAAASNHEGALLALWEPPADPARYFKEVFRSRLISQMREVTSGATRLTPQEELQRNGSVDIIGYSISRSLYESVMNRTLEGIVGERPRPLLLLQMGGSEGVRREYRSLVADWQRLDFDVEADVVPNEEVWWFGADRGQREAEPARAGALVERTTEWVVARTQGAEP